MIIDVSNGGVKMVDQETQVFRSEAACEAEGARLMKTVEYPGDNLRSISMCLPESIYDAQ